MYIILLFFLQKEKKAAHTHANKTTALNTKQQTCSLGNAQTTEKKVWYDKHTGYVLPTEHCLSLSIYVTGK